MCERKNYVAPQSEFIELKENVFADSCETRWSDTGKVVVDDGYSVYCDCKSYAGYDYTTQTPTPIG